LQNRAPGVSCAFMRLVVLVQEAAEDVWVVCRESGPCRAELVAGETGRT
jgi:hypothetical protein